jgi:anthranilate phosphoribosyltransferase
MMDIKEAISKVVCSENLTEDQTRSVFEEIMTGKATTPQISAFITALRMKGETVDEITGAAKVMREKAVKVKVTGIAESGMVEEDIDMERETILDTCGTGGTGTNTFNISTTVAFVLAANGIKVAKHGNRAASSRCGSADVLEEMGVKIDVPVSVTEECINTIGVGFLFAPLFHGAMKYAAPARKEIGIRTIFNILGPLSNPAAATSQILGVFDGNLTETMAEVLGKLGVKRAYVVHGEDMLDEVTITGSTKMSELRDGKVKTHYVEPKAFDVKRATLDDIKGGTAKDNAKIVRSVLSGEEGPRRDIVLINSSVGLMAADKVKSFKEGVRASSEAIDSGEALKKLEELIKITNRRDS